MFAKRNADYETLNSRLLGRILIIFFSIHASMYLNFYIASGLLTKRIRDRDVILGLTAITSLLLLGTSALSRIRNYSYLLFFTLHVSLSIFILPALYFHVSHLRPYILEAAAVYALLILQRNLSQRSLPATLTHLPSTNLLSITLPLQKKPVAKSYKPGQHIYLSLPSPVHKLRLNPFSIANLPCIDSSITLFIRPLASSTKLLSQLALSSSAQPTPLLVEGPYGSSTYFPDLLKDHTSILLIAGGVGATFTLPIYRHLLQSCAEESMTVAPKIRFVWSVRQAADAEWGLKQLRESSDGTLPAGCEIYVSGSQHHLPLTGNTIGKDSIELQERETLLNSSSDNEDNDEEPKLPSLTTPQPFTRGRPDLPTIVKKVFEDSEGGKVAVLVCGPSGLGKALRREVGGWVWKGREVFWHEEVFGW